MPDMYDDLVAGRPAVASELLPADTQVRVSAAIHRARRRRILSLVGVGTAVALVAGFALWQGVPRARTADVAGSPEAPTSSPTVSASAVATGAQRAVVVTTPTPLTATIEPRPVASRRVATGMTLRQADGETLRLCVGPVLYSYPVQCSASIAVSGVSWDQITWKTKVGTITFAAVDVTGVLSGTGLSSTLSVDQIGPVETFPLTSDSLSPGFTPPPMTCLRSSDLGGDGLEANGLETVSGYQGAWTDGQRFNVATLADPLTVENQVRALGYRGPLCVGTLPGPAQSELVAAQQSVTSLDGVLTTSVSLSGSLHLEVGVLANTPTSADQIQALTRAKSATVAVVVTPQFLTIT